MSDYEDIINRAAHTIMVESWGVTEEHPEGVGGFGSPPVELVRGPIRDALAALSADGPVIVIDGKVATMQAITDRLEAIAAARGWEGHPVGVLEVACIIDAAREVAE
jgi:hypothetical protein